MKKKEVTQTFRWKIYQKFFEGLRFSYPRLHDWYFNTFISKISGTFVSRHSIKVPNWNK